MTPSQKKTIYGLLQQLVRLRDGEWCLRCGKHDTLQLSHIYPKGKHRKMEFMPENLKLLCYACHFHFWHKSPIEAWEWLRTAIPEDRVKMLRLRANTVDKTPFDYKLYKLYLEKEIEKLKK